MIYMWFTGINYCKLAFEKDCDSVFIRPLRPHGNQALINIITQLFPLAVSKGGVVLRVQRCDQRWTYAMFY